MSSGKVLYLSRVRQLCAWCFSSNAEKRASPPNNVKFAQENPHVLKFNWIVAFSMSITFCSFSMVISKNCPIPAGFLDNALFHPSIFD